LPNFDVWYPLGISATLYSLMTVWLALKRFVKKIRRRLGLSTGLNEINVRPSGRRVRTEYPITPITVLQPLEMPSTTTFPKNNM